MFGEKSLKLRGKMETYYQKKMELKGQTQSEVSIPSDYKNEFRLKDKENIFKDIYSTIRLFDRIIYEAKKELEAEKRNKIPVR